MQKLIVSDYISLDRDFVDANGEMRSPHNAEPDTEWDAFAASNASGGGVLVFGRVTCDLMASLWPTPMAAKNLPTVAEGMNRMSKVMFSGTIDKSTWKSTRLVKSSPVVEMRKMKQELDEGICILGSGSIVAQLAPESLIDEYQFAVIPVVLGKGHTMFEGATKTLRLKTTQTRAFANGNVLVCDEAPVSFRSEAGEAASRVTARISGATIRASSNR